MVQCPQCDARYADGTAYCVVDGTLLVRAHEEAADPLIGRVLDGRYRVEARLGAGGFGVVYRATQIRLGRPVAIKVLLAAFVADPGRRRRFLVEARAVSQLTSPHTVRVLDFGELPDGVLYLVMELLTGESLARRLQRGPLPLAVALEHGIAVSRSLEEAHQAGVVHRDIKPDNIFLHRVADREHAKLIDFGIARVVDSSGAGTGTGAVIGTAAYMAPEQATGRPIGARADLYALGVVLFEMVSGTRPFRADSVGALLLKAVNDPRPSLARRCGAQIVPAALDELVAQLMRRDPDRRPEAARAVSARLEEIARGLGVGAPSVAAPPGSVSGSIETDRTVTIDGDSGDAPMLPAPERVEPEPFDGGRAGLVTPAHARVVPELAPSPSAAELEPEAAVTVEASEPSPAVISRAHGDELLAAAALMAPADPAPRSAELPRAPASRWVIAALAVAALAGLLLWLGQSADSGGAPTAAASDILDTPPAAAEPPGEREAGRVAATGAAAAGGAVAAGDDAEDTDAGAAGAGRPDGGPPDAERVDAAPRRPKPTGSRAGRARPGERAAPSRGASGPGPRPSPPASTGSPAEAPRVEAPGADHDDLMRALIGVPDRPPVAHPPKPDSNVRAVPEPPPASPASSSDGTSQTRER